MSEFLAFDLSTWSFSIEPAAREIPVKNKSKLSSRSCTVCTLRFKGADVSDINLARILKDGEQVYVYPPSRNGGSARSSVRNAPTRSSGPIVLNRASAKELEALDGIGPVLATRIVAYRNANGPFVTLEALLEVSGIGPAKFAQFKEKIRLWGFASLIIERSRLVAQSGSERSFKVGAGRG